MSSRRKGVPLLIRAVAAARNSPTPTATVRMSTWLGMADTCLDSTCKSGSAMVVSTPRRK